MTPSGRLQRDETGCNRCARRRADARGRRGGGAASSTGSRGLRVERQRRAAERARPLGERRRRRRVAARCPTTAARTIVILGYQGEPYLRFGHDEVFQNTRSPTTYVNRYRDLHARGLAREPPTRRAARVAARSPTAPRSSGTTTASTGCARSRRPAVKANPDLIQRIFALARARARSTAGASRSPASSATGPRSGAGQRRTTGCDVARARRLGRARRAGVGSVGAHRGRGGPPRPEPRYGDATSVGQFGAVAPFVSAQLMRPFGNAFTTGVTGECAVDVVGERPGP